LMLEVEVPLTYLFSFLPVNRRGNSRPGSASKLLNQKYLYRFKGGPEGTRTQMGSGPAQKMRFFKYLFKSSRSN